MNNISPADKLANAPEESESLNPQAFVDKLAEFERNFAKRRKWSVVFRMLVGAYTIALLLWLIVALSGVAPGHEPWPKGWVNLVYLVNAAAWIIAYRLKKDPVEFFNSLSDKRAIGFLIEVISLRNTQFGYDKQKRKLACEALIRLLRDLNTSDETELTSTQRLSLANIALKEDDGGLVNAIIQALAQIGREESVMPLEALAAFGSKYQGRDARDAARQALIKVRERAELDKVHSVLLRPTEGEPAQHGTLVRPSFGPTGADASVLLQVPNEQGAHHLNS